MRITPALPTDAQQAGLYAPGPGPSPVGAVALIASRTYIVRFVATRPMTITKIAFALSTAAGANDSCDVGIFNSGLTTLLASAGSTAGKLNATAGVQSVSLTAPYTVSQGTVYYAAFACSAFGGSAAQLAMINLGVTSTATSNLFGLAANTLDIAVQASAFPLAAPVTPVATLACPVLALLQ